MERQSVQSVSKSSKEIVASSFSAGRGKSRLLNRVDLAFLPGKAKKVRTEKTLVRENLFRRILPLGRLEETTDSLRPLAAKRDSEPHKVF